MNKDMREKIIVAVAAVMFFAAFGAVVMLDSSHGTDGEGIGAHEVNVDVAQNDGHISLTTIFGDLLILGSGATTKLDFTIENNDRDNDIDTIDVVIPGGTVIDGTSTWFDVNFPDHPWNFNATQEDTARFQADEDKFGRVYGGSAQYDVVGLDDDALDHFESNDTIPVNISESVTVTVEFTAPQTPGIKGGNDGIQVSVGDLMVEDTPDTMTPIYEDGYPYLVIANGFELTVIDVASTEVDLEVQYGSRTLFSGTRASGFMFEDVGFKYTSNGHTIAVVETPDSDDVSVKPVIKPRDGITADNVGLSYMELVIDDISLTGSDIYNVEDEKAITIPIPDEPGQTLVDTDGDFIFDINDDDDDNDGIPDVRDPQPLIEGTEWINTDPVIDTLTSNAQENTVEKGEVFVLTATASDADDDPIDYDWTLAGYTWTDEGATVTGPADLDKGEYIFTLTVTDDKGGQTSRTITIEVVEEEEPDGPSPIIWIVLGIALVLIVIVVVFIVMRGKDEGEDEGPEEIPAEEPLGGYEAETPSYPEDIRTEVQDEEDMDEDLFEGDGMMVPPEQMMDEIEQMESRTMGTVPVEEEEDGSIPTLPGDTESVEVQDLEDLIDEMERTEEEIGDVCPECNSPLGPYDAECSNCGAQFEVALECPNCGAIVEDNVDECPSCGVSFM